MKRSKPSRFAVWLAALLAAAACTAEDTPPRGASDVADSSLVVPSASMVPSPSQGVDGRPVIAFLGTSLTAGLGLESDADTYVTQLSNLADSAGVPFRPLNAGVSGDTSAGGLRRLDWVLREPVDVLFVELGANDGLRGQSAEALEQNLTRIIQQARSRYPDVRIVLAGMEAPPNLGDRYTAAFRAVFSQVSAREDVALVPFLLDGVAGVERLNQEDRIHPTPEGHRRIAGNVWPVLEPILTQLHEDRGS